MTATTITPAMRAVIAHVQELGPRWGLKRDTCAAHAVLYLVGRPMTTADLAQCLGLSDSDAEAAIEDVIGWRMARRTPAGLVGATGEPWDLLFAAFEERRRGGGATPPPRVEKRPPRARSAGAPWDLLFAAFEERRRREIAPALEMLTTAARMAQRDGTPRGAAQRIRSLLELVRDLATLGDQVGRLSSKTLARLVGLGGRVSRFLGPTRT